MLWTILKTIELSEQARNIEEAN